MIFRNSQNFPTIRRIRTKICISLGCEVILLIRLIIILPDYPVYHRLISFWQILIGPNALGIIYNNIALFNFRGSIFYFCKKNGAYDLIARYGNEFDEFITGLDLGRDGLIRELDEAYRIAKEKGLIK